MSTTSFFSQVSQSFETVPTGAANDAIDTVSFLAATEDLIKLFDFLNPTAFAPVKSDMAGNVKKIRDRYSQNPELYKTLQKIVQEEQKMSKNDRNATIGLMWLRRGLEFTSAALRRNITDVKEELSVSFSKAYDATLQKHHNMLIRPIFYLALKACPYRKDFYKKLGGSDDEAGTIKTMEPWLAGLEKCVKILVDFYLTNKYEC